MTVYAKKVSTTDPRFSGRSIDVFGVPEQYTSIPVPDSSVVCNGCNENLYPDEGYLVYLGKRELKADQPYDIYCLDCLNRYFKGWKDANSMES